MDAANTPGTLTTQALLFRGNRLHLNIHTAGSGSVKVALLQPDGTPNPGFTASDCEVLWKADPDLSALAGKPVRVQLEMRNAKLFPQQFGSTKEQPLRWNGSAVIRKSADAA